MGGIVAVGRIAVVGAGVMGAGIAQSLAVSGFPVVIHDLDDERLAAAMERVEYGRYGIRRGVDLGKLTGAQADEALARIASSTKLGEAVADVDLVVEAVFEDLGLKIRVFRDLDALAPPHAILASNTSGFQIAAIAAATERPEKVIGWHWASPAAIMRLAEIVVHPGTAPETTAAVETVARATGRQPVVVKDDPMHWGFVANRVFMAALDEARRIVADGIATPEQVDQLLKDCFRWPAGPFEITRTTRTNWDDDDPNTRRAVPEGHATTRPVAG
jgi:3-hydroxybutyryl-CoA dehydrogenase